MILRAACAALLAGASAAAGAPDPVETARIALARACAVSHVFGAAAIGPHLPGYKGPVGRARAIDVVGWRVEFLLDGATVALSRLAPRGRTGRVNVALRGADGEPLLVAVADTTCRVLQARRMLYDETGAPAAIERLDGDLTPTGRRDPVNPPVPALPRSSMPAGVPVGLVDTGVNYLLPEISARLARGADGGLLGYDYWDLDRRPFDSDPVRSPLFPARHGTRTASLVARESGVARLVPYRYPRPDMSRMAALVADAAGLGVRIVNVSLASGDRARWRSYEAAARANPDILFVVAAGNRGRDIDREPMYPAALGLDNQLVATAATGDGRLAGDANWGRRSVDLMVSTEGLRAVGFDGAERAVSGSSFAAARVAALAACLLAARPGLSMPDLAEAILARASRSAEPGRVARGFLPDPTARRRGACAPAR